MQIVKNHIPKRINNPQTKIVPVGIILHYIGNPGTTARQNASYFHGVASQISVHYIIDDKEIIEIIAPECKSFGTSKKAYNESYIQIEMCHPDRTGKINEKTLENTVWLCRRLMNEYGIRNIIRHFDVTGKACPLYYVNNPAEWVGLKNRILSQNREVSNGVHNYKTQSGMHIIRIPVADFKIKYWDGGKRTTAIRNYFSLGFSSKFKEGEGIFTLPIANLCADIDEAAFPPYVCHYLKERGRMESGKAYYDCGNQFTPQFQGKKVSTLIVDMNNNAKIMQTGILTDDIKYAVSGVPVVVSGSDPSWVSYASKEGWDSLVTGAAWHGFLGLDSESIVYVAFETKTANCVQSSEAYNKLKSLGLKDVIMVEGGKGLVLDYNGKNVAVTSGNERINTVGMF